MFYLFKQYFKLNYYSIHVINYKYYFKEYNIKLYILYNNYK